MPGESLLLEVTESSVVANTQDATNVIQELRAMGVGISIDDFGTGHSSLASIRDLSPTEVKIDQSFVRASASSSHDTAMVRAAVELGRSLGMQVVAEGVDTPEVLRIMSDVGCDLVQGFLILPPVPADQMVAWSRQRQTWSWNLRTQMANRVEPKQSAVLIIVYACLVVLALEAVVLRGRLARLTSLRIRRLYLIWLALANEVVVISILPGHQASCSQLPICSPMRLRECSCGRIDAFPACCP